MEGHEKSSVQDKVQEKSTAVLKEMKVKGNQLVDKVQEIIGEGNARRVIIKKEGRTLLEFPLSVGVGGATAAILLAPQLAAIGALAALVTDVSIFVEHEVPKGTELKETTPPPPPPSLTGSTPLTARGP